MFQDLSRQSGVGAGWAVPLAPAGLTYLIGPINRVLVRLS
jgi:hypothetical protein